MTIIGKRALFHSIYLGEVSIAKKIVSNWRTTLCGVCSILCGVYLLLKGSIDHGVALFASGIGLIIARDA